MPPRRSTRSVSRAASETPGVTGTLKATQKGSKSNKIADESSFSFNQSRRVDAHPYSLMNTSVKSEANAIVAAQAGYSKTLAPPPNTFRASAYSPRGGASPLARSASPQSHTSGRSVDLMRSYVEENARATTPVTYFMQAPRSPDRSMDDEPSTSMGNSVSLNNSSRETADEGLWPDHVYGEMEQEMQRNRRQSARRRRVREDAPWRPSDSSQSEDEEGADSGIDGVGVVASGGLDGRSGTRGKTKDKGEGYLGQGLGIRRRTRKSRADSELERVDEGQGEAEDVYVEDFKPSPRPQQHYIIRETSVLPVAREYREASFFQELMNALGRGWNKLSPYMRGFFKSALKVIGGAICFLIIISFFSWLGRTFQSKIPSPPPAPLPTYSAPVAAPDNFDELNDRFHGFERSLGEMAQRYQEVDGISRVTKALEERLESLSEKIASLEALSHGHSSDLSKYGRVMDDVRNELQDIARHVTGHDGSISEIKADVKHLTSRLSAVEAAVSDGRLKSALERILPELLPVRYGKGKDGLVISPSFWLALKEILVGKSELVAEIRKVINEGVPIASGERSPTESSQKLEEMVHTLVTKQMTHLVDKKEFMTLLESEIDGLRRELRSLQEDWRKNQPAVAIKDRKGQDLTSEVQHLIDAALLKYSKDTIAKADYALFSAGASVIPSHTTDTLVISKVGKLANLFTGQQDVLGNPPATALTPDNTVGNCWAFKGSVGSLGVQLSRKVYVSHITVEHLAKELALDTSSAPREVEVWAGLEDDDIHAAKVAQYLEDYPQDDTTRPQSPTRFLLAKFTYDVNAETPIQTFPVRDALFDRQVPVQYVVFQIDSNAGAEYTCLYRVRVHGEPVE